MMSEPVIEIAELEIAEGSDDAFLAGVRAAVPLFQAAQGFRSLVLRRSIERPQLFRLMIEWERLEDHTVVFRSSAAFARWRELVGAYFLQAPVVDHSRTVLTG